VLALCALLAGLAIAAALLSGTGSEDAPRAAEGPERTAPAVGAERVAVQGAAGAQDPAAESEPIRAGSLVLPRRKRLEGSDPLAALRPERFAGRGEIRVRCATRPGAVFPERWVLELAPARALIGSERAESRRLELDGNERETVVSDLPLAGYEVRASAPLCSAEPVLLLLSQPSHTSLAAELRREPAGFNTGSVVPDVGDTVEGFELWLESTPGGARSAARTNAFGAYRFEGVLNGEYRLHLGAPEAPLREPFEIAFQAPTLTMRPIEVPALCELEVVVYDAAGLLVGDALLQGWSTTGGRVEGRTDVRGSFAARLLPPGAYTLIATHERLGRGRGRAELVPGRPAQVVLFLGP
jgi:hypothetical protein